MRKISLLLLALFLIGTSSAWAQLAPDRERGGTGLPEQNSPGTLPDLKTDPKFGDHGSGVPCPPGSQSPSAGIPNTPNTGDDFGDKGGTNQDQSSPRGRQTVPPVLSPDAGVNTPQSRQGKKDGGLSRSDELNQPGIDKQNRSDQFGMTDCPPGGTDRGGSGGQSPSLPGQENNPPVLLPPAGSGGQ